MMAEKVKANIVGNRELNNYDIKLEETIFRAKFKAYTPYLGGDYDGETIKELEDPSGRTLYYASGFPTAKGILGKMRWLARVALAQALCLKTHKEAESSVKTYVAEIKLDKNKSLRLGLIPLMFGSTPAHMTTKSGQWKGIITLKIESSMEERNRARIHVKKKHLIDTDFTDVGRLVIEKVLPNNKRKEIHYPTVYALLKMGRSASNIEPIRADNISFWAELYVERERLKNIDTLFKKGSKIMIKSVKEFAEALLVATLVFFGIGRGANRGFGRFVPDKKTLEELFSHDTSEEFKIFLRSVKEFLYDIDEPEEKGIALNNALQYLIMLASKAVSREIEKECGLCKGSLIPRIFPEGLENGAVTRVVRINSKKIHRWQGSVSNTAEPINEAIALIGFSSTKLGWKRAAIGMDVWRATKSSGLNLHTWTLGLPRSQKFPCRRFKGCRECCCECNGRLVKAERVHLLTGYIVIEPQEVIEDSFLVTIEECRRQGRKDRGKESIRKGKYYIWSSSNTLSFPYVETDVVGGKIGRVDTNFRRQSQIIAFPIPTFTQFHDNVVDIAVLMLPGGDLLELVLNKTGKTSSRALFHAGPHRNERNCVEPVVSVSYSLQKDGIILGKKGGYYSLSSGDSVRLPEVSCWKLYSEILKGHAFDLFIRTLESEP